jgi:hypothetical protein
MMESKEEETTPMDLKKQEIDSNNITTNENNKQNNDNQDNNTKIKDKSEKGLLHPPTNRQTIKTKTMKFLLLVS